MLSCASCLDAWGL